MPKSRGENTCKSQISAKEPGNLHLGRAVTGLGRSIYQRGHHVVSARGFTHRTAGPRPCPGTQLQPRCTLVSAHAVMRAWIFMRFLDKGCSSSPSPSSGVMPRARRRGEARKEHCARGAHTQTKTSSSCPERSWAAGGGRVETSRVRAASVRVSYSAMMDWLGTPQARLK